MDDKKKVQEAILQEHGVSDDALDSASGGGCGKPKPKVNCPKCGCSSCKWDHEVGYPTYSYVYYICNYCGHGFSVKVER